MYESFFEMSKTPFTRNVPPEALYETQAMSDTLGRLIKSYSLSSRLIRAAANPHCCVSLMPCFQKMNTFSFIFQIPS